MQIIIDIDDSSGVAEQVLAELEKYKNQGVKITIQANDYQLPNEVQQQVRDIESRFDKIRNASREANETPLTNDTETERTNSNLISL